MNVQDHLKATHSYVGVLPCGCRVAATVDTPGDEKRVAKDVASFIKDGLRVERVTNEEVRLTLRRCTHKEAPNPQADLL